MTEYKYNDIEVVRQDLKNRLPLNNLIDLVDAKYYSENNLPKPKSLEMVSDQLYKKCCDLDEHPLDETDNTRDSTPSFTVCPQKELFYCFGCGATGDRFEYISKRFNMTHMEAIELCAELEGVNLDSYKAELTVEEKFKLSLYKQNDMARSIAHQELVDNNEALKYLYSRGISDESIDRFMLGYAPRLKNGNTIFVDTISNCKSLQLHRKDMFNDAILFPITNSIGNMRYFQSRPNNPQTGMKYIGANDTHPLFDDIDRIFGFDVARRQLARSGGKLVGVEGAPDTIACTQQGITTCGFLGTSINQNTFDLLDRYRVVELILLLDGDKAGRDKTFKNAEKYLSINTNVKLKIAVLPDGYDPEEFINTHGGDKLKEILNDAVYAIQYLIDLKWNDATTPTAKAEFIYTIQSYMNMTNDVIIKKLMIQHIANKIGMDVVQIEDYFITSAIKDATGAKLYSIDGEETLLGEVLRKHEFIHDLTSKFNEDDWYLLKHRHLFRILKSTEYCDIESIYTIAKNMNIDNIITHNWLNRLYANNGNVDFSLKDVEDKLIRRKALSVLDNAKIKLNDLSTDTALVIDQSTTNIYNTAHKRSEEKVFSAEKQVDKTMEIIMDRMNNPVDIIGHSFGDRFKILDAYTLGLQAQTLTVVAANQSVGKTQICQNFALYQATELNVGVLWFSLEMDSIRMTYRNLAILSDLDSGEIMKGNINLEQKMKLDQAAIKLRNSNFTIAERGHDLSEALSTARRYVQIKKVEIVYVDYAQLQYVTDRRTETRSRELGTISKAWKQFSKDENVAVVLISQLGKQALEADTAEAEHGYGSYEIAQDADNYFTLKDKSKDEIEQLGVHHGNKTMNISKNRMGEKSVLIDIYSHGGSYIMQECN